MKIALVLDDTLDSTDGVQQYVINISKQLEKNGHEVHFLVGETKRTDIKNVHSLSKNLSVHFNQNRMSTPLPSSRKTIETILSKYKFDVIHVQMPFSPFMASAVISKANKMGIPVVATFHILPASKMEAISLKALIRLQRKTIKRINTIIAVSAPAKDCIDQLIKSQSAKLIPNPVDVEAYKPKTNKKQPSNKVKITFVGRLVERKGALQLLKALIWLHERNYLTGVKVNVCGDGPLRNQLERLAKHHKLSDIVEFKGRLSEEDKISDLQSSTIAVFPSTGGESFGIVLIEAMAAGVPCVIGGDNPGYRYVMNDNQQQLVDPNDTAVFAAQLLHFMQNEKARTQSHKWQQKRLSDFELPKVTARIEEVYVELIENKRKD